MQKYKNQREEEQKQKEIEKEMAKCPPGTRRMPTPERLQILNDLNQTRKQLEGELMKFPISMKTMAIQKRKAELEEQVLKIEASIKTFSKDTVYVGI